MTQQSRLRLCTGSAGIGSVTSGQVEFDLFDIEYLQQGSERQRRAYQALKTSRVLDILREGDSIGAVLAGSIPIDLAVEDSDLDIIVTASDLKSQAQLLKALWGEERDFRSSRGIVLGVPTLLTTFRIGDEDFEIFSQTTPIPLQNAVRHLLIEERLLKLGGSNFRAAVLEMRRAGMKTEPAFGAVLQFAEGIDPYRELLELEERTDSELRLRFARYF